MSVSFEVNFSVFGMLYIKIWVFSGVECSNSRFNFKNGLYSPENLYFDIQNAQNTQVDRKTNLMLAARRSEYSDMKFDLKNGFYAPENPYFDGLHVNVILFYDFVMKYQLLFPKQFLLGIFK